MAGKAMTLVAARTPQLRKRSKRDWSKAKAREFLAALAETCNVSEACRRSGIPMTVAYRRRKMDAGFRAEWAEQIAIGYHRLEAVLLERAFNGTERVITKRDGSEEALPGVLRLSYYDVRPRLPDRKKRCQASRACHITTSPATTRPVRPEPRRARGVARKPMRSWLRFSAPTMRRHSRRRRWRVLGPSATS